MSWTTLTVEADAEFAQALSDQLLELGALSVDLLDADADTPDEQAIFGEPGEASPGVWQHNRISALFNPDQDAVAILTQACNILQLETVPDYQTGTLDEHDWVRLTQAQFDPIQISDRLWIVPSWHQPDNPQAINLTLDPGLAFGTGSHPTTRLCLQWLDRHLIADDYVLDYGCGSGILAIAAVKLGAVRAVGVDLDPQAVTASCDNREINQLNALQAQFYLPDELPASEYDLVIANILTNPLKVLAPLLAAHTRPGGRLVLSGILDHQAEEVMQVYQEWFDFDAPVFEEGWSCLSGRKRTCQS